MSQPERRNKSQKSPRRRWQVTEWGRWLLRDETLILLVGTKSYKIQQADAKRIQEHTGKPFHQLTEKELLSTMDDLEINSLDMGDEDKKVIKNSDVTHTQQVNPLALLTELKRLCDEGVITQEEFELRKQILINKLSNQ